jgi:hypothetical protein
MQVFRSSDYPRLVFAYLVINPVATTYMRMAYHPGCNPSIKSNKKKCEN